MFLKRIVSISFCVVLCLWFLPEAQAVLVPGVSAESYVLMDAGTETVLAARGADTRKLVASTTKILTAVVTLEQVDPDEMVEIEAAHVGIEGSSMYLRVGETLTVRDLLYGLMLSSGNDAAVALAYHVAGGVSEFALLMNERAATLGMTGSQFANPHGLDAEGHYSTARDMALLAAYAMELEVFAEIVSTRNIQAGGRSLVNHNKLLWRYPGAEGVKTGFTKAAGRSLVSSAEREGTRLICVTLSAPDDWDDHGALLDWGFANYQYRHILTQGDVVAMLPVISGTRERVSLVAEESLELLIGTSDEVTVVVEVPRFVYATVSAGEQGGRVTVAVNGETVLETRLLYDEGVALDETNRLSFWEEMKWQLRMAAR